MIAHLLYSNISKRYLYIKIETKEDVIFDYDKENNLNVLLNINGNSGVNWERYNYIINRYPVEGGAETSIEKCSVNGAFEFELIDYCESYLSGNIFALKIPLNALGINETSNFTIDLKVVDKNLGSI